MASPALTIFIRPNAYQPRLSATDQTADPMVSNTPITGLRSEAWTRPFATSAVPATVRIWRMSYAEYAVSIPFISPVPQRGPKGELL